MKLQAHNTEARGKKYKNAFHCAARILTTEGVRILNSCLCLMADDPSMLKIVDLLISVCGYHL